MNKVLIIGYVWVAPNSSAAGSRMLQLITLFQKEGYEVTFASPAQKSERAMDLSLLHVKESPIELNDSSFDSFIQKMKPSIVLFDRFMMEEQFGWRVAEYSPNSLRILDTEDLHCLRKTRHEQLKKGESFSVEDLLSATIAKREIAAILRCDMSLIISSYEMELLQTVFKIDRNLLYYLPFLLPKVEKEKRISWKTFEERSHFVCIGNFLHAPNVDAVLQMKKRIWKNIRKQLPKVELHIYGAYMTQQITQLHNEKEGFLVKGYAKEAKKVVENARVVIAPLRFGAGIKGKLTEGMSNGTPSITTSIGAEGMHANLPWNGFVEDDFEVFSEKAVTLYENENVWKKAQQKGIAIINQVYDKERLGTSFIMQVKKLQKGLELHRQQNFLGRVLQHQTLQATKYMSKWIEEKNK
ncbi:Glycosyltransferase, family GT4 [Tenacibaculum maritimum]|uniref:glycosyltransferase family 4 protein n=1 Tax=Tenacibaculum maritimum TaxID=107401 RepID=UPI0012E580EA|nr:glycosyltransferase family 4 protein [Tenacibaculum maritimum]CAA0174324.1 Glycosyltransferase, family GT4 [Tenacibaculum maritimum]